VRGLPLKNGKNISCAADCGIPAIVAIEMWGKELEAAKYWPLSRCYHFIK
jgi:hypothetical protein